MVKMRKKPASIFNTHLITFINRIRFEPDSHFTFRGDISYAWGIRSCYLAFIRIVVGFLRNPIEIRGAYAQFILHLKAFNP